MRRLGAGLLVALLLLIAGAQSAAARPGGTVFSYGHFGTVDITEALPGVAGKKAVAMAVGPQDESIVLSSSPASCAASVDCWDLSLTRYDASGALDAAFGARAGAVLRVELLKGSAPQSAPGAALAVAGDGSIVVASGTGSGIAIARLTADGSLDPAFGTDGRAATVFNASMTVTSVAFDSASVFVGAFREGLGNGGTGPMVVTYTSSGQLGFGFARGSTLVSLGNDGVPAALAVSKGSVYLGVPVCCSAGPVPAQVGVIASDGTLARTIKVAPPRRLQAGKPRGISGVIPKSKGAVEVVGSTAKGSFVARFLANGKPDTSFGERGYAFVRGLFVEGPSAAVADKKGRIVLTGWRRDPPDTEGNRAHAVRVFRLLANGRPDPKFGGVRPLLTVVSGTRKVGLDIGRALGIGMRSDGRTVVLGEATADPREGIAAGPYFGLALFLGQ